MTTSFLKSFGLAIRAGFSILVSSWLRSSRVEELPGVRILEVLVLDPGKVIAVGPRSRGQAGKLIPIGVEAGDGVLFGKWSGTEVKIDGVEYRVVFVEAKASHTKPA